MKRDSVLTMTLVFWLCAAIVFLIADRGSIIYDMSLICMTFLAGALVACVLIGDTNGN